MLKTPKSKSIDTLPLRSITNNWVQQIRDVVARVRSWHLKQNP